MSQSTPVEPQAPLNLAPTLVFILTFLAAVTLVPYWGVTHGFSVGAWVFFILFTGANGMAITGGYHRLWAHKSYDAHWSVRLLYMVFGTMALQNSVFCWASNHRTHHLEVDDYDRDPYSIKRGFWFAHMGWMMREYPSGIPDFTNIPDLRRDPMLQFQHRFYVPLTLITNFGFPARGGLGGRRSLGNVLPRGRCAARVGPPCHLLHQLPRTHVGSSSVHRREFRAR